ncbi:MAG: BspA family leucine-rich repeat surface protein [Bacilli bacterium]|nr:BspA family leucine-rich repeat surface protein [Bacilli bacterium]
MKKEVLKLDKRYIIIPIVIIGLFIVLVGSLFKSYAILDPVKSISFSSEKLNYENNEPGSVGITKSAEWVGSGKARVTFDLNTVLQAESANIDLLFVLDLSGSMEGEKLNRVKEDTKSLMNILLSNQENRVALITFESKSEILSNFTNEQDRLVSLVDSLFIQGGTNYYKAFLNIEEILRSYEYQEERECIVLFLTDGYPNADVPNQIGEYQYIKSNYPYVQIHGIQYEMGNTILSPIEEVSDRQYIADIETLDNVLFQASLNPVEYESIEIVDYIDSEYFTIDSVSSIKVSSGEVELSYEGEIPKIRWSMRKLPSGSSERMTIDIQLKKEYLLQGGSYPTNQKESITYQIEDVHEKIESERTPVLASRYLVEYEVNEPTGCRVVEIPESRYEGVKTRVEVSNIVPSCEGYHFNGWKILTNDALRINGDLFLMPESDVLIRGEWSKLSITKSLEGEVYQSYPTMLRKVVENEDSGIWKYKSSITKIVFQNEIKDVLNSKMSFDISADRNDSVRAHLVPNATDTSTYTAYIQGDGLITANKDSSFLFYGFTNLESIGGMEYFDTTNVENMLYLFRGCEKLKSIDLSHFDTSKVTTMSSMFFRCSSLTSLDLSSFDTSNVTTMADMFSNCKALVSVNVSSFDTSNVRELRWMFGACNALTSLDLTGFQTGNVVDMQGMFYGCKLLTTLDLSSFDTSKVTDMGTMFSSCQALKSIKMSNFDTSQVTKMNNMFDYCRVLSDVDLSHFDTSKVTNMSYMFELVQGLTSLDLSHFDTSNVTDMQHMFHSCIKLTSLNLTSFDTSKVTNMTYMFYNCNLLTELDLSSFVTGNVTNMGNMFQLCKNVVRINLNQFNTSKVTDMKEMFFDCLALTSLDLSHFNTSKVVNMSHIFSGCSSMGQLNISHFDTSQVVDMDYMFFKCEAITKLDISTFNTSKVTNMSYMFGYCGGLSSLDLGNFDTSNVTNMGSMFDHCQELVSLNLNHFNTSQVTNMAAMFSYCQKLASLVFGNFNTFKVTDMSHMFDHCSALVDLNLENFETSNVTNMYAMFGSCNSLINLNISSFNTVNVTNMSYMFSNCDQLLSLDLRGFDTSSVVNMDYMFYCCRRLNATITIRNPGVTSYILIFRAVAQYNATFTVNYTIATSSLVDAMIATKGSNENIVKGSLIA